MRAKNGRKITVHVPKERRLLILGMGEPVRSFMALAGQHLVRGAVCVLGKSGCDQDEERKMRALASEYRFPIAFVDDVSTKEAMDIIGKWRINVGINYGGLWIYPETFIDFFHGRFVNCHAARLPDYRGPGDYSWEVLNDEKSVSVVIHQMVRKVDAGAILIEKSKRFEKRDVIPLDFHDAIEALRMEAFTDFLQLVGTSSSLTFTSQDEQIAAYWPRIESSVHGAINVDWGAEEVRRFINAFREPLSGAFLFYGHQKIFVKGATISPRRKMFHPFMNGLLIHKTQLDYVEVVVGGESILLSEMYDAEGRKMGARAFRLGDRFHVPMAVLEEARRHTPRRRQ